MNQINTLKITNDILKRYGLQAKKSMGQNFLIDDNVLQRIVQISNIENNTLVIEIGPGLGNLTHYLQNKDLLLIELDTRMINVIEDRFLSKDNIKLINKDVLKLNIDKEIEILENKRGAKFDNVKVVANLPYYITSPIIFKLLEESSRISEIIIMIQEEVANRITAKQKTKDYGILTIMVDFFADASKEISVPNSSFIPTPNVTSAVIKIRKKEKYKDVDIRIFKELIQKSFANRRKKILNSLTTNNFMNLEKEELVQLLKDCNIEDNARAEELDIQKYVQITKTLMNKSISKKKQVIDNIN